MQLPMFLRKNLVLKIVCVLISMGLWGMVKYTQSPMVMKTNYQTSLYVAINYINTPEELTLVSAPDRVVVIVKGDPSVIESLSPLSFKAIVDLRNQRAGQNWVDIDLKSPPGVTVTDIQPVRANITLEAHSSRTLPININILGNPKAGFSVKESSFSPKTAEVSGLRSKVSSVSYLRVDAKVNGFDSNTKDFLPVIALDSAHRRVDVSINPDKILLSITISPGYKVKTVSVVPAFSARIPKGYTLKSFEINPSVVSLKIKDGSDFKGDVVYTSPLNLSRVTGNTEIKTSLQIGENVEIIGEEKNPVVKVFVTKEVPK